MFVATFDYLLLSHRSDLNELLLRWTRPATSEEHYAGYEAALAVAKREQVSRWLVDLRRRGLAESAEFHWIVNTFRTRLAAALPGVQPRLAYLVAPYHADTLSQRLLDEMSTDVADNVAMRVFTEEQAAQAWLQSR